MSNLEQKYVIAPQLADVDRQPYQWVPYIMRRAQPNYRSQSLNTDQYGFRQTYAKEKIINFEDWCHYDGEKGAVIGNSVTFGVGCSHDRFTVASLLNSQTRSCDALWFNLSQRASNLTQERLVLEFFAPLDISLLVWISGVNDLVAWLLGEQSDFSIPAFIGGNKFLSAVGQNFNFVGQFGNDGYKQLLNTFERQLLLVKNIFPSARKLFALQPLLTWNNKPLTAKESVLVDLFDGMNNRVHRVHSPKTLAPFYPRFARDLECIVIKNGFEFFDLNENDIFKTRDDIFIDRIHLTDAGHERLASVISQWSLSSR
jgi:hypothetical protein